MAYLYDLTDTWNAAGTVFNAIRMNVTNTASAAGSKIVSLQVGATDRFTVDKDGNGYFSGTLQAVGSITAPNVYIGANSGTIGMQDNTASILAYNATGSGGITNTLRFITGAAERVRIDGSGNVGIGTSSPSARLTLQESAASPTALNMRNRNSTQQWALAVDAASVDDKLLAFIDQTNSAVRMALDSSGNVGIGTTAPSNQLSVGGNNTATISLDWTGDNAAKAWFSANHSTGEVRHAAVTNYFPTFYSNNSERMRIDLSGNVGIGTNAPQNKLDVNGSVNIGAALLTGTGVSTGDAQIELGGNRTGNGASYIDWHATAGADYELRLARYGGANGGVDFLNTGTGNFSIGQMGAAPLLLLTSGSERARIDSSGNLLVGKTAVTLANNGFAAQPNGYISCSMAETTAAADTLNVYSTGASAYRFYVTMGGAIYATSTTITAISDIRLKENVRELDAGLDVILALKPRRFDWKEGKGKDVKDDMGFIAQEVEEVLPALIGDWKAGEGEPDDLKSVKAGDLIPVLVKAIQELTARVAQLEGN